MARKIRDVMTADPTTATPQATLTEVARLMRDHDIGDILIVDGDELRGVVTDRDLVVRALAENSGGDTPVQEVCSDTLVTAEPDDDISRAVRLMREHSVRRLPVVDHGHPVGVVSIGDLAVEREPGSALADISADSPNH
ncbi:CBS domain-containing protein [Streptomyces sp. TRM 70361]|uniref:CBS domain-containing protein n=1 Tax=Streptomyces sp. TRM 70361 TaxID=3116553 RepID=UPI002E7AD3CA|nr:CBS domain-containing protein [Streptomyces sp. TRM 70361]MEE1940272.1 CBS domain-containing protein [Streptomyces sp. TRM 70361]